jgi:hypothetical protein
VGVQLVEKSATADADRGLRPPWRARSGVVVGCIGLALGLGFIAGIAAIIDTRFRIARRIDARI